MMLLDTCIVIDVLRGREAAVAFVNGLPEVPSLSAITATELIAGARNARERRQIERLLEVYTVHDIGLEIASLAGDYLRQYGPSHGVDPIDALIAATAKTANLELATLNLKHFPMFKGLKRPYRS
ncbi:type II toxin-antitoxin system VapC family toxin [Pelomicrobium methylotrophicum]|uniref:Ribonuclease VapC n=1 Tax=Pelomicrobium methylotrophicum TaxID=2602750 RepID=A0A5C7EMY2_9PROT|nr:type II toxin-antitoxin system VapC family toxin [Pelomicrobium methylotrophicum]TXF13012.1 type II toxin-antitoxin system VapC family toxin [Pelomicrobium methylotrophicum]